MAFASLSLLLQATQRGRRFVLVKCRQMALVGWYHHVDIFIHSFNDTSCLSSYNTSNCSLQPAMCGGSLHQRHPVQNNKDSCEVAALFLLPQSSSPHVNGMMINDWKMPQHFPRFDFPYKMKWNYECS
jgi:hypothetical protein